MNELPYRQIHLDFHTSPFIQDVGSEFDAAAFAKTLKAAHVDSVNIFAKCHHGMCYYPTKLGRIHPGLKFDLMGEMIKACHAEGIKAPIYFPVGWEEVSAEHAEFLEVDENGVLGGKPPFEDGYYRWENLCLNKKKYIDFVVAQTEEIIDRYETDGFWYDIVVQHGCRCADCLREMKALGLDPKSGEDVRKHDFIVVRRFMERLYNFVKSKRPEALVFFNMSLTPDNGAGEVYSIREKLRFQTHYEIESLPSGEWGYDHFPFFVNYLNTLDKQVVGMTGRFHKSWGDHGSLKNTEALEFECFRMIANGAKCCVGDQLHPRGRLDPAVYGRIGGVYRQIEKREPWCTGSEKVSEIGVFLSNTPLHSDFASDEGAMHMLMELHRPFDFLDRRSDFSGYRLIIFPDSVAFDDGLREKTKAYLAAGGKVIASYRSCLNGGADAFALEELGVEFEGETPFCPCYMRLKESFSQGRIEAFDYVAYEQGAKVRAKAGSEVLAVIGRPYFNRTYDRFCSHCQTPFEELTDWPAVVRNGNCIYLANPLFHNYKTDGVRVYRDIVRNCIDLLVGTPLIDTTLPSTAELTVRSQKDRTVVHMIHYIPQRKCEHLDIIDEKIPLYNIAVAYRSGRAPRAVYMAPERQTLPFTYEDGIVKTVVPSVEGHQMLVLEY